PAADVRAGVDDVAAELAESVAGGLHRALEAAVAGERGAEEASVVMERIGAAYRGFKTQRIEGLAGDAVTAAFARGTIAASDPSSPLQWVVDDEGRPCPDCDDNALAGPTPPGDPFPTGQPHPPAHAGCRCLLAPARLPAAVAEAG
ncbi:MAG: hypothetical protein M3Q48_16870, partial [Actinomycetota bacterium]|nr:hypothetical protein [Actinomycetota bacterium]